MLFAHVHEPMHVPSFLFGRFDYIKKKKKNGTKSILHTALLTYLTVAPHIDKTVHENLVLFVLLQHFPATDVLPVKRTEIVKPKSVGHRLILR